MNIYIIHSLKDRKIMVNYQLDILWNKYPEIKHSTTGMQGMKETNGDIASYN